MVAMTVQLIVWRLPPKSVTPPRVFVVSFKPIFVNVYFIVRLAFDFYKMLLRSVPETLHTVPMTSS